MIPSEGSIYRSARRGQISCDKSQLINVKILFLLQFPNCVFWITFQVAVVNRRFCCGVFGLHLLFSYKYIDTVQVVYNDD